MKIQAVFPAIAVPGGAVRLEMEGLDDPFAAVVRVGGVEAERMAVSRRALTIRVPDGAGPGVEVSASGGEKAKAGLRAGRLLADELHSVGNPALDAEGNVYATFSGARGEQVPYSVFVIRPDGSREPFLAEIVNPTGLAVGPDRRLYVSSRHTGTVYRSTLDKQVEKFAEGLGLATGLAFDAAGNLLVGDRNGFIRKISPQGEVTQLCELEPSVSAYHLAMGPDGFLYVTGPTLSTQDGVWKISPEGRPEKVFHGLGRPQGIAFGPDGTLQVAASYRGRKGIFSLRRGKAEWTVAGPMLVGLAYSSDKSRLLLADNAHLYEVRLRRQ